MPLHRERIKGHKSMQPFPSEAINWGSAWTPRYCWKIATRLETQITHTRDGRQSLAPVVFFLGYWCQREQERLQRVGYRNDSFFSHTNPYISNVTQQCRCSPMLIFRTWASYGWSDWTVPRLLNSLHKNFLLNVFNSITCCARDNACFDRPDY